MQIGILGTGMVGRTLAGKFAELGHDTTIGTRDVSQLLARSEPDQMGNPPFREWHALHQEVTPLPFHECAAGAELLVNATSGHASLEALEAAGSEALGDKILIDAANPLDFSQGFPPSLFVSNTDSLAEQIQNRLPQVRVVKSLNTVSAPVMIEPAAVAGGEHVMFVCGNDAGAKAQVETILRDWLGWKHVLDLGDITAARGLEMYLPLWLRLYGAIQGPMFNIAIASAAPDV